MNDQITNEKQSIEIICQDRLNENAAQVFSEATKKNLLEKNSHQF
jgi:hypothetical protein